MTKQNPLAGRDSQNGARITGFPAIYPDQFRGSRRQAGLVAEVYCRVPIRRRTREVIQLLYNSTEVALGPITHAVLGFFDQVRNQGLDLEAAVRL